MNYDKHSDLRKHKRVSFIKDVEVPGVGNLRCANLSEGGMFLETVFLYSVGTLLTLRFKIQETDEQPINVQAQVVFAQEGVGVGLCFLNLKAEDRIKIEEFVEQTL